MFGYQESKYTIEDSYSEKNDDVLFKLEIRKTIIVKDDFYYKMKEFSEKKGQKVKELNDTYIAYMIYKNDKIIEDILIMYDDDNNQEKIIEDFNEFKSKKPNIKSLNCRELIISHNKGYTKSGSIIMY